MFQAFRSKNILFFILLACGVLLWQVSSSVLAASTESPDPEQEKDIKKDIEKIEEKLEKETKQLPTLQKNLQSIQGNLSRTQKSIETTKSHIDETSESVERKQTELVTLDGKLLLQKGVLAGLVRTLYYSSQGTVGFPGSEAEGIQGVEGESVSVLQGKMSDLLEDMTATRTKIAQEKGSLETLLDEKENLLDLHQAQQADLLEDKNAVQRVVTQKQATIGELQAKLSKLKGDLSELLGKSYDAKDIEDAAQFAAKATGIRKDFLMGMLVVESGLGRYTGGCDYKESRMSANRLDVFKTIAKELGKDYKKLKVSCPPKNYTGTGGAMGVAQFMSDTWMGYKARIGKATGHNPPDPWNLTDGVAAMAIKLTNVPGVSDHKRSAECNAAKLYLSGSTSTKYDWYCERVLYWADNYEKKL